MKKRYLIFGLCLASTLSLVGCGNNQEATLTNLANQIDLVGNTITSVNSVEKVNPLNTKSEYYQSTNDVRKVHKALKTAILSKNAMIKNKIKDGTLNLSKDNARALAELSQHLSSNAKKLEGTKSDYSTSLKEIKNLSTTKNTSTSQISAKISKLSNCMDSQSCYYKNILTNLNNIESILGIEDDSFDNIDITDNTIKSDENNEDNTSNELQALLYQYLLNNLNNTCPNGNCNQNDYLCPNNDCNNNCVDGNCNNCIDGNCNNCIDGNCNQVLHNGTNKIANKYYGNNYNPNRNTDTFYPWNKNIDTYRNNMVYNNSPVNTLEKLNNEENSIKNIKQEKDTEVTIKPLCESIVNLSKKMKKGDIAKQLNIKKGHTKTISMDINKNIKDLIKGKSKETFNNSYIFLR